MLDEIVALFPSPYIHIGGDEVHYGNQSWFTDPEIQQFIKDKNLGNETGLEQYFIRRGRRYRSFQRQDDDWLGRDDRMPVSLPTKPSSCGGGMTANTSW